MWSVSDTYCKPNTAYVYCIEKWRNVTDEKYSFIEYMYNHAYSYWNVDSWLGIRCSTDFLKKQRQKQKTENSL